MFSDIPINSKVNIISDQWQPEKSYMLFLRRSESPRNRVSSPYCPHSLTFVMVKYI